MKYRYFYQSKKNENLDGWITARNRDEAYAMLRKQGIKPYKVLGRNPLPWKPWVLIGVLALAVAYLLFFLGKVSSPVMVAARAALYGDASTIQRISADGWRASFKDEGDAFLARHAIPGVVCSCGDDVDVALSTAFVSIQNEDGEELRKMKRMVNGMKEELKTYLDADGTIEDYIDLCCERVRTEKGIQDSINGRFNLLRKKDPLEVIDDWEKENKTLRSLGLPTVPLPIDD